MSNKEQVRKLTLKQARRFINNLEDISLEERHELECELTFRHALQLRKNGKPPVLEDDDASLTKLKQTMIRMSDFKHKKDDK